jgi:hypothetical protein
MHVNTRLQSFIPLVHVKWDLLIVLLLLWIGSILLHLLLLMFLVTSSPLLHSRLRVKGVKRLRVIDASIMPAIISGTTTPIVASLAFSLLIVRHVIGNTNAPVYMIAEKGADMIKAEWLWRQSRKNGGRGVAQSSSVSSFISVPLSTSSSSTSTVRSKL